MAVDSVEDHRLAVDQELISFDFNPSKADFLGSYLNYLAGGINKFVLDIVESG